MSIWTDKDGRLHVGIMVGGKRVHRILPEGAAKGDAKQLEADLRAAIGHKRQPAIPDDPPMTAILGLYQEYAQATLRSKDTAVHHSNRLGHWAAQYRASHAREMAAHVIRDMQPVYAAGTINRSLGTLKKALSLAWERGLTLENYGLRVKRLPEHNLRDMTLSMKQVKHLADCASQQTAAAIWIAIFTGLRRGEILALTKDDIGPHSLTIRAGNTKTLKTRTVPIAAPLRPYLKAVPLGINFEGLKTGFRRAREAAEMPWVTFHDLRRSCATLMIEAGVDLLTVSKLLGHSSVAVTQQRYAHLQVDAIRAGLERTFGK